MKRIFSVTASHPITRKERAVGIAIVLFFLVSIYLLWFGAHQTSVRHAEANVLRDTDRITGEIERRLEVYSDVLYGGRGLALTNVELSRENWDAYMDGQNVGRRYPGIVSIAYVDRVAPREIGAVRESLNDARLAGEPEVHITTSSRGEDVLVTKYVSKYRETNSDALVVGTSIGGQAHFSAAIERAGQTGYASTTAPYSVADETYVMGLLAIYGDSYRTDMTPEERISAVDGYVALTANPDEIIRSKIQKIQPEAPLAIVVTGGENGPRLYVENESMYPRNAIVKERTLSVGGVPWHFEFRAPVTYGLLWRETLAPIVVPAVAGIVMIIVMLLYLRKIGIRVSKK